MAIAEIVLPVTEPETEWVRGRPLQKVSPTRDHALLQAAILSALQSWALDRGEVGAEWRFRIAPPGEAFRPLVPDVAYVATERLRGLTGDELQVPKLSPDIAVEVLTPGDRRADVDDKIETYIAAGSRVVIIVDPRSHTVELHDSANRAVFHAGDPVTHPQIPGFELNVSELFAKIAPPR